MYLSQEPKATEILPFFAKSGSRLAFSSIFFNFVFLLGPVHPGCSPKAQPGVMPEHSRQWPTSKTVIYIIISKKAQNP